MTDIRPARYRGTHRRPWFRRAPGAVYTPLAVLLGATR